MTPNYAAIFFDIGDLPSRDVVGSQRAGFGMCIIIGGGKHFDASENEMPKPDLTIRQLNELLDIFPRRVEN